MKLNVKILIYDIETTFLKANIWRLGEQAVRHNQLDPAYSEYDILTISYKWFGDKKIETLVGTNAIEEFDQIVRNADIVIGKNNNSFDNKHINTQRLLKGLKPLPEWGYTSDDLERQLRKYFIFPSYSLDYLSKASGLGGKIKMEFSDWVDIANLELVEKFCLSLKTNKSSIRSILNAFCNTLFKVNYNIIAKKGAKAWKKMIYYNKKDVRDTDNLLSKVLPYIKLKHNAATKNSGQGCTTCGSMRILPTKVITSGQTRYQLFDCLEHDGYAGRASVRYDKNRNKVFGKMG